MLGDISNQQQHLLQSPRGISKQQSAQKDLAASSSSSPSRLNGSSSPLFSNSRLDAFHASSSPGPTSNKLLSTPTKRSILLNSLPPSSPSFGLSSLVEEEEESDLSSPRQQQGASTADLLPSPVDGVPLSLRLEVNSVLYFGRKAKKAIPRTRSPGYNQNEQSIPILLPKSAKNASRIHCSARIVKVKQPKKSAGEGGKGKVTIEVRVTGQNGMRIDGKLWKAGTLARLTVEDGRELELSFWGWDANVTVVAPPRRKKEESSSKRLRALSPASSSLNSLDDEDDNENGEEEEHGPSKRSRLASPTTSLSSVSSSPASLSPAAARARSLASSPDLDLPGLLASTIVFHPRSTVGVDELVRALLKESGQQLWQVLSEDPATVEELKETMRGEEDAVRAWIPVCQEVLKGERMFGMIDNTGLKDAAGRPLPPYYYYIPDLDSSRSRVEALEPFVKRVRGARTSKPIRYFWAKPK